MKSFAAMLFGSLGIAALFFTFVLLSNASANRARPIHFMCPDRYGGGAVLATKWNVVHLVCVRVAK